MDEAQFEALETGDVIRHTEGSEGYLVVGNYGEAGVIVTRTTLISNPPEWDLILKANHVPLAEEDHYVFCEEDYNPETKIYERYHHLVADTEG